MNSATTGILVFAGVTHLLLIVIPVCDTLRSSVSRQSKLLWCIFLLLVPIIAAALFHFKYRSSLVLDNYKRSSAEERARAGTLAPDDFD